MGRSSWSDTSEKDFQKTIIDSLKDNEYEHRSTKNFDKNLCLDKDLLLSFIQRTQKDEWDKLKKLYKNDVESKFLYRLTSELDKRGIVDVLRNGIKDSACQFRLLYPLPNTNKNPKVIELFEENQLSVFDELEYEKRENGNRLDLVVFINGLPIITIELKDTFSQGVQKAIKQYREDRNPKETIFSRCFVHFAMSDEQVYMATKLEGQNTKFLPFNKSLDNDFKGEGFKTAYMYEDILLKKKLINIITNFLFVEENKETKKKVIIFPRYHQLDCVNSMFYDCAKDKAGKNYLVQHSAGSGKTKTIAWLSHRLINLNDEVDKRIFDVIIVVSDRKVIDKQLQDQVKQFEKVRGLVKKIDKNSTQLKEALVSGKNIIITTIQKFPYILESVKDLESRNYAVIIDEAHSSQTGENAGALKQVLSTNNLEEAEKQDSSAEDSDDTEDIIVKEMKGRKQPSNVSFFAFTATPKNKTLEMFGRKVIDAMGKEVFVPYHIYSMKQAIEEGFILDVLKNYMTYSTFFKLFKKIEDDPEYEKGKATRLLMKFVQGHPKAIADKTKIMIEHFNSSIKGKIRGKAKVMVVTSSRLHAVKYKKAFDKYLKDNNYPFKSLVAFSGTVKTDDTEYTENSMNKLKQNERIQDVFNTDEYKFLIVANKFQTGFDEPLLHTMYVDKILKGITAVQTLSRLNRTTKAKDDTLVIDFANDIEHIQKSFKPYYESTFLDEGTDPNKLYDMQSELEKFMIYDAEDVDNFISLLYSKAKQDKLHRALDPVIKTYLEKTNEEKAEFKSLIKKYIRIYSFLSQIMPFEEVELEKLHVFAKFLVKKLPAEKNSLPLEVTQNVDIDSLKYKENDLIDISLNEGDGKLKGISVAGGVQVVGEQDKLSNIVNELNDVYGNAEFDDNDKVVFKQLENNLTKNENFVKTVLNNPDKENIKLRFNEYFENEVFELQDKNFNLFKKIMDDNKFNGILKDLLFDLVYSNITNHATEYPVGMSNPNSMMGLAEDNTKYKKNNS